MPRLTEVERFWRHVDKRGPNDCWHWLRSRINTGYGKFYTSPTDDQPVRTVTAHRYAYEVTHGPIPSGLFLLHSCDTRTCVNPSHLRVGTHRDNMLDMVQRGRSNKGRRFTTHCPQGHIYDETNTYIDKANRRHCRPCERYRRRVAYWAAS